MRLTLPPRGTGGLDADLHQDILRRPPLPAVIGGDRQLVLVLLPVVQLLCVFYITFQGAEATVRTQSRAGTQSTQAPSIINTEGKESSGRRSLTPGLAVLSLNTLSPP